MSRRRGRSRSPSARAPSPSIRGGGNSPSARAVSPSTRLLGLTATGSGSRANSPSMAPRRVARGSSRHSPGASVASSAAVSLDATPPVSLKRGRKRKDASLESPAPDVAEVLQEHYAKRGTRLSRIGRRTSSDAPAAVAVGGGSPLSSHPTTTLDGSTGARRRKASVSAVPKKKKARLSKAALNAAAEAAVATASVAVPPSSSSSSKSLTQALPFLLHMLDRTDLLRAARVAPAWYVVAQSPIVWNSASALAIPPGSLARAAQNPVLHNAKRLRLTEPTTRDEHLKRNLLAFPQLGALEIEHLELNNLFSLTEELGFLGRNLTSLTILLDTSLWKGKRVREEMQRRWKLEDDAVQQSQPGSMMDVTDSTPHTPSSSRRLPSLYSFVSLLSLLPNLIDLHWVPVDASDFARPNLKLKLLSSVRIQYPRREQIEKLLAEEEVVEAASSAGSNPPPPPPTEKTPEQLSWLRGLPSLTSLSWPGWSLGNIRALCLPVVPELKAAGAGLQLQKSASSPVATAAGQGTASPSAAGSGGATASPGSHTALHPTSPAASSSALPPKRLAPPQLLHLNLGSDLASDAHLAYLSRLQSLTSLSLLLADTEVTDAGLQSLCSLELLHHLELKGISMPPEQGQGQGQAQQEQEARSTTAVAASQNATQSSMTLLNSDGTERMEIDSSSAPPIPIDRAATLARPDTVRQPSSAMMDIATATPPIASRALSTSAPMQVDRVVTSASGRMDISEDEKAEEDEEAEGGKAPGGGLLRQQGSIVSARSTREARRSAVRSVSIKAAAEQARLAREGWVDDAETSMILGSSTPRSSAAGATPNGVPPTLTRRRSFADLEVVRLASLCSLKSLILESIDLGREGLHIIFHSLNHLTSLCLRVMILPTLHPLACLTRLRRLTFQECTQMRESSLIRTLSELRALEELRIVRCTGISERAVAALKEEKARALASLTVGAIAAASSMAPRIWPALKLLEYEPAAPVIHTVLGDGSMVDDESASVAASEAHPHPHPQSHPQSIPDPEPSPIRPCRAKPSDLPLM